MKLVEQGYSKQNRRQECFAPVTVTKGDERMTNAQKSQIARINRKLAKRYHKLCTSRSWREKQNLGDYHVIDTYTNTVVQTHVAPDTLERELRGAA